MRTVCYFEGLSAWFMGGNYFAKWGGYGLGLGLGLGLGIFQYPIDLPTSSNDFAVIQRSKARHGPAHVIHGLSSICTLTQQRIAFPI